MMIYNIDNILLVLNELFKLASLITRTRPRAIAVTAVWTDIMETHFSAVRSDADHAAARRRWPVAWRTQMAAPWTHGTITCCATARRDIPAPVARSVRTTSLAIRTTVVPAPSASAATMSIFMTLETVIGRRELV